MKIFHYDYIEAKEAEGGSSKVKVRYLIDEKMGAKNFAMRMFEIEPEGYTPFHVHEWEHEVFILKGEGVVVGKNEVKLFREGDVVFIPPKEKHQFRNTKKSLVKILCIIPNKKGLENENCCGCG
ncbi:cupin domain-containing protein [Candidatus Bathyarchaeota archaeon]|nr:cupin domain-containing protein [Candidatus Bathyarchaeota archaeon]